MYLIAEPINNGVKQHMWRRAALKNGTMIYCGWVAVSALCKSCLIRRRLRVCICTYAGYAELCILPANITSYHK